MRKVLVAAGLAVMSMAGAVLAAEVADQGVDVLAMEVEAGQMFEADGVELKELRHFGGKVGVLGEKGQQVIARAMNRAGSMARTQVVRALSKQTGLPQKTLRRAVHPEFASPDDPEFLLEASGGEVGLKFFRARETRRGVVAYAFNERRLYQHAFIRGGSFQAGRVDLGMGHRAFQRDGKARLPIDELKSGVFIPLEMVQGQSEAAFDSTVADVLPRRIEHEIGRVLG